MPPARRTRGTEALPGAADSRLFTLEVSLVSGPVQECFLKKNRVMSRTIQIRADQTLQDLHDAIFSAFDRWDDHLYEFQIGGKGPMDPKARRYTIAPDEDGFGNRPREAGLVSRTTLGSLGLKVDDPFGYWFDFGDDWYHQVSVAAIETRAPAGRFPRVTARIGKSPPQYPDAEGGEDE